MGSPDRRTALRAGVAVLGLGAAGGLSACSDTRSPASGTGVPAAAGADRANQATAPVPARASGSAQAAQAAPPASGALPPLPQLPAEVGHAPSGRPQVALTFHGDGDPALARQLLAEAERAGARLTVLAVGRWLAEHPEMARRVLDGGHELGNHTEHHAAIETMAPDAAYAEIQACADRLRKLTGSPGRWFRPSQTQHANAGVLAAARRAGYGTVLSYDVDPGDYQDPPAATTEHRFLAAVRAGSVVSLHLGHPGTVAALPPMLDALRQRGLAAVTASELFA